VSRSLPTLALVLLLSACVVVSEYAPHSTPIEVGGSVEWIIATDCGLDNAVFDIDGSLWVPSDLAEEDQEGVPEGFQSDNDTGTLTLRSENGAEYRSSQGRVIELNRLVGNLRVQDCVYAP
jgi:hypothetical protein